MNDSELFTISNLLDTLDVESYEKIFIDQIENEENDYTSPMIDNFSPLWTEVNKIFDYEDINQDDLTEILDRFNRICRIVMMAINNKFGTQVDIEELSNGLPANTHKIAYALYQFFVINLFSNICTIMKNYIIKNSASLVHTFSELSQKKDVVTTANKKVMSEQMSIICSNIYDITDFIFSDLDAEEAMDYCDDGDVVAAVMKELLKDNTIANECIQSIADIYKDETDLRSRVCFEIVYAIRNGDIKDIYKLPESE